MKECNAFHKKDYANAISHYSTAISLDPTFTQAYLNRATARYDLNDFKGAIDDYTLVITRRKRRNHGLFWSSKSKRKNERRGRSAEVI